jgi:hypothetical protein
LIACSSPAKRSDPPATPPRDAAGSGSAMMKKVVKDPFTLEVMDVEVLATNVDPATTQRARELTAALRAAAREYGGVTMGTSGKAMIDLELLFNCEAEAPACMAAITKSLPADRMIWGTLEGDQVKLHLITAASEIVIHWVNEGAPIAEVGIETIARDAIHGLLTRAP